MAHPNVYKRLDVIKITVSIHTDKKVINVTCAMMFSSIEKIYGHTNKEIILAGKSTMKSNKKNPVKIYWKKK